MIAQHPKKRNKPIKIIELNGQTYNFYECLYADEILHTRYMVAEIQEMYIRYGISEGFLKEMTELIINRSFEAKDLRSLQNDMVAIGNNLKARIGMIAEKSMYAELACVYFMLEDEPIEYDEEIQAKKKQIWHDSNETDFFIFEVFKRMNASQNTSLKDLLAVFQAVEERVAQLQQI